MSTQLAIGLILIAFSLGGFLWMKWDIKTAKKWTAANHAELQAQDLFEQCWNGHPESVLYAWYRARQHMVHFYSGDEDIRNDILRFIEARIRSIQELETRHTHINQAGRIITVTEIG